MYLVWCLVPNLGLQTNASIYQVLYQKDMQYFNDFEKSGEVEANVNTKPGSKKTCSACL